MKISRGNLDDIDAEDLARDLFPYDFFAYTSSDSLDRFLGRMIIKANEAGLKGVKVTDVDIIRGEVSPWGQREETLHLVINAGGTHENTR